MNTITSKIGNYNVEWSIEKNDTKIIDVQCSVVDVIDDTRHAWAWKKTTATKKVKIGALGKIIDNFFNGGVGNIDVDLIGCDDFAYVLNGKFEGFNTIKCIIEDLEEETRDTEFYNTLMKYKKGEIESKDGGKESKEDVVEGKEGETRKILDNQGIFIIFYLQSEYFDKNMIVLKFKEVYENPLDKLQRTLRGSKVDTDLLNKQIGDLESSIKKMTLFTHYEHRIKNWCIKESKYNYDAEELKSSIRDDIELYFASKPKLKGRLTKLLGSKKKTRRKGGRGALLDAIESRRNKRNKFIW